MENQDKVTERYGELDRQAKQNGYSLNPDKELTMSLVQGLVANKLRYGEEICPCRLMMGGVEKNKDIICPCDYRDADLADYGSCFCGLYVSPEVAAQGGPSKQTPERRPSREEREKAKTEVKASNPGNLPYPVWRCKVCGYLCANTNPPRVCPICKAKEDRFERFL